MSASIWIPDSAVRRCNQCSVEFSFFNRRHHCRLCGKIFCANCTGQRVRVPSIVGSPDVRSPPSGMMYGALQWAFHRDGGGGARAQEKRCCNACADNMHAHASARGLTEPLLVMGDAGWADICDWRQLCCLNRAWKHAMETLLKSWKETLQLRPYSRLTNMQRRMLTINAKRIHGHASWSVLAKACGVEVPAVAKVHPDQWRVPCDVLGCSDGCGGTPVVLLDAMLFLTGDETAAQRMLRAPSVRPLLCMTNTLSSHCAMYPSAFEGFVLSLVSSEAAGASHVAHMLFFGVYARDPALAGSLLLRVPGDVVAEWKRTLLLTLRLRSLVTGTEIFADKAEWENALLPHDPTVRVQDILFDAVSVKGSSTKPIIVPCTCVCQRTGRSFVQCFLLKKESVFADAMVQECVRFLAEMSRSTSSAMPEHVVYGVQPIDPDTGIITMHAGCRSLYSLWSDRVSIQNYVMEHNQFASISTLRQRFSQSCAVTAVVALLVGAGDRHLDNLLLTRHGCLLGVDFSYIFGEEPNVGKRLLGNQIRITRSMIEMMGGMQGFHYHEFRRTCTELYSRCRKWHVLFYYVMRALVLDGYITEDKLQQKIETTWLPGSDSDSDARVTIEDRIDRESRGESAFFDSVTDLFHHMFHSSS